MMERNQQLQSSWKCYFFEVSIVHLFFQEGEIFHFSSSYSSWLHLFSCLTPKFQQILNPFGSIASFQRWQWKQFPWHLTLDRQLIIWKISKWDSLSNEENSFKTLSEAMLCGGRKYDICYFGNRRGKKRGKGDWVSLGEICMRDGEEKTWKKTNKKNLFLSVLIPCFSFILLALHTSLPLTPPLLSFAFFSFFFLKAILICSAPALCFAGMVGWRFFLHLWPLFFDNPLILRE